MLSKFMERVPRRLLMLTGFIMAGLIGYLDYLTGDYSVLIFYMIPVALVCWRCGRSGLLVAFASGVARYLSDYNQYDNSLKHCWNSLEDMLFLLVAGFLVYRLRRALDRETLNS